jgi:hypothetical protein
VALQDRNTSAGPDRTPPRRWRFWLLGLAIGVVLVAVLVGRQGDDGGVGGSLNAIAEAAVKTQRQGGGRAALEGSVVEAGHSKSLTFTGQVVYDDGGLARGSVTMTDPESDDSVKLEYVQDGARIYMKSSRFGSLPEGREWMGLDFSFGDEIDTSLPGGDAKGELEMLEKAAGGVEKVGREDVRGVLTTRYRGSISVTENVDRLREEGADKTASYVEKLGKPVQVEVWVDAKGLVRRMRIVQSRPGEDGEGPTTIDLRTDFFDFGLEPEIDVPDSDEVFDGTSLAEEQLDASSDE